MEHGAESHLRKPSLWCSATWIWLTHHPSTLDYYAAESEYQKFLGDEVTIAKCYISVIHHLASVPPQGVIQLIWTVTKIEWQRVTMIVLHFLDGSTVFADQCLAEVVPASFSFGCCSFSRCWKLTLTLNVDVGRILVFLFSRRCGCFSFNLYFIFINCIIIFKINM